MPMPFSYAATRHGLSDIHDRSVKAGSRLLITVTKSAPMFVFQVVSDSKIIYKAWISKREHTVRCVQRVTRLMADSEKQVSVMFRGEKIG